MQKDTYIINSTTIVNKSMSINFIELFKTKNQILIGRSSACDVSLEHKSVSKVHARIHKNEEGKYLLEDLDSTHGIEIGGKKIKNKIQISEFDDFKIGIYQISISKGVKELQERYAIRAEKIKQVLANGNIILHECSFEIPHKSIIGILGPSGCGKSTLVKALMNYDSKISSGKIFFGDKLLTEDTFNDLRQKIGYTPQTDTLHEDLTVQQAIYFAANLRLPYLNQKQRQNKIDEVLTTLKINHIRNILIKKISGGQKKRLSIAVEILSEPDILFLDEPTSPLDPQAIEDFLKTLKNLAREGTSIVIVTHKPDDLFYMDKVIMMAKGGHFAYYGPPNKILNYFNEDRIVSIYANMDGVESKFWIEKYLEENKPTPTINEPIEISKTPKIKFFRLYQFWWLFLRYLQIKINDKKNIIILLGQAPLIATLLILIFNKLNLPVVFFISLSAIWFGINNAAREIVFEQDIFKRERMFNQSIAPYILSKISVLTIISALQALMFCIILSFKFKQELVTLHDLLGTSMWMVFISLSATLLGLLISATSKTTERVMTILPLVLLPQIMLSGIIEKINNQIIEALSFLALSKWGTLGLTKIQDKVEINKYETVRESIHLDHQGNLIGNPVVKKSTSTIATNSYDLLVDNFHSIFNNNFKEFKNDFILESFMIIFFSIVFYLGIYYELQKKDPITIKDN